MKREEHSLIEPGMTIRIGHELHGNDYGADNPEELRQWFGKEVTVKKVDTAFDPMVWIEEDVHAQFFMEEIECIVDNEEELDESDMDITALFA